MSTYIIFFKKDSKSFFSRAVAFITKSPYSHAGVLLDGVLYDASESRGSVGYDHSLLETYKGRDISVYGISNTSTYTRGWVRGQIGRAYDYYGVLGWLLAVGSKRRVYCFEWALEFFLAESFKFDIDYGMNITAEVVISQLRRDPVFEGAVEDFNVR